MSRAAVAWGGLLLLLTGALCGAADPRPVAGPGSEGVKRLACLGDSITAGSRAGGPPYPDLLRLALGDSWEVVNLGVPGATVLRRNTGEVAYSRTPHYARALELKADVVTIALGTNDSKAVFWKDKADFEADYEALITEIRQVNPAVVVYCCLPPPAFPGKWGIDEATIDGEVIPLIEKVAAKTGCRVVDLHAVLEGRRDCVPDTVHPNADGQKLIAAAIHAALTARSAPGATVAGDSPPD